MCYRHLIQEERYKSLPFKRPVGYKGPSQPGWDELLLRSVISRELNRNRVIGPYQPQVAGLLAAAHSQKSAASACRVPAFAWQFAREKLAETWSPQQIAGHQRAEHLP